jgi:dihydroorotate dehydrogenase (NAD+) catalytic subunit
MKLTPNVADITEIARAVESEGADCVSLINTLLGMKIDVHRKKPVLWNRMGGLSGPAIKPVAVRMVYQVRRAVSIPIIGLGGIMTGEDAVWNSSWPVRTRCLSEQQLWWIRRRRQGLRRNWWNL